jgi:hypothetical protein
MGVIKDKKPNPNLPMYEPDSERARGAVAAGRMSSSEIARDAQWRERARAFRESEAAIGNNLRDAIKQHKKKNKPSLLKRAGKLAKKLFRKAGPLGAAAALRERRKGK